MSYDAVAVYRSWEHDLSHKRYYVYGLQRLHRHCRLSSCRSHPADAR
jgi:hypothetical protein